MTEQDLAGLPLATAEMRLKAKGMAYTITEYSSKRPLEGAKDWRVGRCAILNG